MKGSFFFYLVFIFFLVNVVAKSNSKEFEVENALREYLVCVDGKDVNKIAEYFYFDRKGWDRGPVFSFGDNGTIEFSHIKELKNYFSKWSSSNKAKFVSSKIESMEIFLIFDGKSNKLYNVDAIISRIDNVGTVVNRQRNLYYFQSDKTDESWTNWKIYMLSNISL